MHYKFKHGGRDAAAAKLVYKHIHVVAAAAAAAFKIAISKSEETPRHRLHRPIHPHRPRRKVASGGMKGARGAVAVMTRAI